MRERKFQSWQELLKEFDALTGLPFVYRGQCDADWPLKTSLERHVPKGKTCSGAEDVLIRDFKRRAHVYVPPSQLPTDDVVEWLALMQHFGAPTRLLDFTESPYVAAYFAAEDAKRAFVIWAVDTLWLTERVGAVIIDSDPRIRERFAAFVREHEALKNPPFALGAALSVGHPEDLLRNRFTIVANVEPERMNERLSIQQGAFLCPGNVDKTFLENLEAMGDSGEHVQKFIVPAAERETVLQRLRLMNITRASLFPGLDGFAQSFRQRLLEEPEERRKARLALRGLERALIDQALAPHEPNDR